MAIWNTPLSQWRRVIPLALVIALGGCGDSNDDGAGPFNAALVLNGGAAPNLPGLLSPDAEIDNRVTGSIGDGPIVGARVRVFDKSLALLQESVNNSADYDIRIKTKARNYPLSIVADQGSDLVAFFAGVFERALGRWLT